MEGGFRFGFGDDAPAAEPPAAEPAAEPEAAAKPGKCWRYTAAEAEKLVAEYGEDELKTQKVEGVKLVRLQAQYLSEEECSYARQLKTHDIVKGVYEGGFKLWSCAGDLVRYLRAADVPLEGKVVLEAGCGHGLPAIHALQSGAATVVLQDYNEEVLRLLTTVNVLANTAFASQPLAERCEMWAGDWRALCTAEECAPRRGAVDVILSTDTLYTMETVKALVGFIRTFLARDGVAYIGSKTMYFGCGGGVSELLSVLAAQHPTAGGLVLQSEQVERINDGVDNIREVLAVRWAEKQSQ